MYKLFKETINPGDNVIVGLGDSFTQGVGAYSDSTWASVPGPYYNVTGQYFLDEQYKNNWLTQLRDNHLPEYKIINLGINGTGNRAAVKELYLNDIPPECNVTVILMASGINRFDFIKKTHKKDNHLRWQTIWPMIRDHDAIARLEKEYLEQIYSPRVACTEFLLNVAEAESFCNARGYNFFFASAFDNWIDKKAIESALEDEKHLINIVDWNNFIAPKGYNTFMEMMCDLEGLPKKQHWYGYCEKLKVPKEYLTPCAHWTPKGHSIVAKYIYELCF